MTKDIFNFAASEISKHFRCSWYFSVLCTLYWATRFTMLQTLLDKNATHISTHVIVLLVSFGFCLLRFLFWWYPLQCCAESQCHYSQVLGFVMDYSSRFTMLFAARSMDFSMVQIKLYFPAHLCDNCGTLCITGTFSALIFMFCESCTHCRVWFFAGVLILHLFYFPYSLGEWTYTSRIRKVLE